MTRILVGESVRQQRASKALARGLFSFLLGICAFPIQWSYCADSQSSAQTAAQEKAQCTENLKLIYAAIEAYRNEQKDLPNWLSDLVPDYLPDANVLICPVCRRTGQIERPPLADPSIASSYLFEFCPAQLGNGAPANPTATRREWKNRQMAVVGPIVPIVRCRHHKSLLNLAFDGRIYDSPPSWETMLTNTVDPKSLTSAQMFAAVANATNSPPAKKTPPRRNKAAPQSSGLAQTIRVTALDLAAADLFGKSLDEIARNLKTLTPDVVLLRGIAGWKMAAQLVKALEPAHYHVVACSAFGSMAKFGTNANQLAILARKTAYFYWSEPWNFENATSADGGFTFAAIETAGHRFGFALLSPELLGRERQARLVRILPGIVEF